MAADVQSEARLNRLLRRADWRFLLPNPRPARSICFSDGLLAQAVAAITDDLIDPSTHSPSDCDLAVALNPTAETLQAAWAALRPGGACYLEWTSPLAGGPVNIQQRLAALGFTQVVCYWAWPPPDRSSPLFWLPLEAPHVIHYYLANRARSQSFPIRAGNKLLEVMWRSGSKLHVVAPLCVIARKPPQADMDLLAMIRQHWSEWSADPPPQYLTWMLLTRGARSINKVVGLIFAESERTPRLIVKLARVAESTAALEREADNLQAVQASRSDRVCGVPQILFAQEWAGQRVIGETALTGRPLYALLRRDDGREWALKVTDWLAALVDHAAPCARSLWWERLIETTLGEFERNFARIVEAEKLQATRASLDTLGDLPLVCEQRDCSPWNVLVGDDGELVILDWESAEPRGLPALDLIYFLTYVIFFIDGTMESGRFRESYREMLSPTTFTGQLLQDCQQRYLDRTGIDPAVLPPLRLLTWMIHSRSEYRRLAAEGDDPDALRHNLFVSLWEEELAHACTDR